jgi:hypothetical protein
MKIKIIPLVMVALLAGCGTQPSIKQMENDKRQLQGDLNKANTQIGQLQAQEALLRQEIDELKRVVGVLGTEKTSRVKESSVLRGQVRRFVQQEIDGLREFLVVGDLLDYVGGELVERSKSDAVPHLAVDLKNTIPRAGTLTGIGAHFVQAGAVSVKVLRQVNGNLVVIWESQPLVVKLAGINKISFPVNVGVEKGDVIAYYFHKGAVVSFDEGTGDTRYQTDDIKPGASTRATALQGERQRRSYSIGVYGLLN